ncbi:MAG TPA: DUF1080 domain-containing protein, partial [Bryobacteraceae bacterium]|nr:DUF1080 domain-containing protein [Bryobacteraceae bacterium]
LRGWEVCNGRAEYRAQKGEIVGTTVAGSPNSFLCTQRDYGDFILELETKTDPLLNSGVQIRSHRYPQDQIVRTFNGHQVREIHQRAGRVHGYQVEISNQQRGNSGGIYDEARRGWLYDPSSDAACRTAFKDNEWNHYRVEAVGDRIRTWVNKVPCTDLIDTMDLAGFIALQVHSFKGDKPAEVRWRRLRIQDLGRHEWRPLWDGRSMSGWTARGGGKWVIEDGAIHATSTAGDTRVGYLVSDAAFKDVTVRFRTKIFSGNSGFFVRAEKETLAGYEVEIDAEKRTGGFWETGRGGRAWVTGPEDNSAVRKGDWNEITAHLHGHRIVFHVNGIRTVDLPDDSQGRLEGHLAMQCHGRMPTDVWFRDIAVLEKAATRAPASSSIRHTISGETARTLAR